MARLGVRKPMSKSEIMGRIHSTETSLEKHFRRALWAKGVRGYGKNVKGLPGKPDVLKGKKAVFLHSCFWHLCPTHGRIPKTRTDWWKAKLEKNRERDGKTVESLESMGFQVLVVWEHELKESWENTIGRACQFLGD